MDRGGELSAHVDAFDAIAAPYAVRAQKILRVTRGLRPGRVRDVVNWLERRFGQVRQPVLPSHLPADDVATIELFVWLLECEPSVLDRLTTLWSKLGSPSLEALVDVLDVDQIEQVSHPTFGRFEGHRVGRVVLTRHDAPDGRRRVVVRVLDHPDEAKQWLVRHLRRQQQKLPRSLDHLPDVAAEAELPRWLRAAVGRPVPRSFPDFVDVREAPVVVGAHTGEALSDGAVSGLVKELYEIGQRAVRRAGTSADFGPVPEAVRSFVEPASGQALAAWLLECWADNGGYAAQRWCSQALLYWPSESNTRRLGRVIDEFRSRLHSPAVRFGLRLLEAIGDDASIALLARFARHGSFAQSRDANLAIEQTARLRGIDRSAIDALAPLGMDDFDVSASGVIAVPFDAEVTAEIDVTDLASLKPRWRKGNRLLRRAPPGLKAQHPEATQRLHRLLRRLNRDVRRETLQIASGLVELHGRAWSRWRVYFEHRLLRLYVRGLIWQLQHGEEWVNALVEDDAAEVVCDLVGRRYPVDGGHPVRLLHPADLDEETAEVWRDSLLDRGLAQPLAQLDRPAFRPGDSGWIDFAGAWHDHAELAFGQHQVTFYETGHFALDLPLSFRLVGRWRPSPTRHWDVRVHRDDKPMDTDVVASLPPGGVPDDFRDPFAVWVDGMRFEQAGRIVPGTSLPARLYSEVNLAVRRWDAGGAGRNSSA